MADRYDAGRGPASTQDNGLARPMGKIANLAGAAISLGLIAGVGIWGYKLIVRDVSGVPVVRAAEGPMRVAPEDPGGSPARHQGLAVNTVAAEGSAEQPADRLILAPRPVDLSEEDSSGAVLADAAAQRAEEAQGNAEVGEPDPAVTPQKASIQALADQLAAGVEPLEGAVADATAPEVQAALAAVSEALAKPAIKGGLARSLRPQMRPGGLSETVTLVRASAEGSENEVDAASLPAGTRLVQLGAYESAEVARTEWGKLTGRFTDYLEGKTRVIERAQSGGRTFYRLRAMGFADLSDARRFCSALVAEKADCIPVVTR